MNKFIAILLTTVTMLAAAALLGGQQANAAFNVDCVETKETDCIENVDDLKDFLNNGPIVMQNQQQEDVRDYWLNVLDQDISTYSLGVYQSYYSVSDNPCVVLTASNGDAIITEIDQLKFDDTWYTSTICSGVSYAGYLDFMSINGNYLQTFSANSTGNNFSLPDTLTQYDMAKLYPLFITGYIIYPAGYDGDEIRNEPPLPPIDPQEYYPRVSYTYYGDKLVRATDAAVNLCIPYDPEYIDNDVIIAEGAYYTTCADFSLFNIEYKLIDDDTDVVVDTQILDRIDSTYEYNDLIKGNKYRLEVKYLYTDCGTECVSSSFNKPLYEGATLAMSVIMIDTTKGPFSGLSDDDVNCTTENGVRTCDVNNGPECFSLTAPYIDIPACLSDINVVVNNLSFGAISFVKVPSATECKTLGTIGKWLPLENKTVCPQIPKEIRDIITPFITFALGMIIVIMITKVARGDNNT